MAFPNEMLRLIDANANRAREGIRTCEDYIRFTVQHARWALVLKSMRASITTIINANVAEHELIAARHVSGDLGRPVDDDALQSEHLKNNEDALSVARRGLKRGQEALRVLEEFLRVRNPESAVQFSKHRYTLYEVEQWLMSCSKAAAILAQSNVYVLLTESLCKTGLLPTAKSVLSAGCKLLQLREKELPDQALLERARRLQCMCNEYNAVLICNDRVDAALAVGASGVHVGQDDFTPEEIRTVSGLRLLVGRSTHTVEQARHALVEEHVDYIAIGSMYDTSTKLKRIMAGLTLAQQVCAMKSDVPVFAIGGITEERLEELKRAGVRRIAVSSTVISSEDAGEVTRRLIDKMSIA
jgi:thiamine-phosphate pyrophosphorylase